MRNRLVFTLMLLLGWWLDDWPDQFVAMCAMARLTRTDLSSHFPFPPDWYDSMFKFFCLDSSCKT